MLTSTIIIERENEWSSGEYCCFCYNCGHWDTIVDPNEETNNHAWVQCNKCDTAFLLCEPYTHFKVWCCNPCTIRITTDEALKYLKENYPCIDYDKEEDGEDEYFVESPLKNCDYVYRVGVIRVDYVIGDKELFQFSQAEFAKLENPHKYEDVNDFHYNNVLEKISDIQMFRNANVGSEVDCIDITKTDFWSRPYTKLEVLSGVCMQCNTRNTSGYWGH